MEREDSGQSRFRDIDHKTRGARVSVGQRTNGASWAAANMHGEDGEVAGELRTEANESVESETSD